MISILRLIRKDLALSIVKTKKTQKKIISKIKDRPNPLASALQSSFELCDL